nr:glutamine--fructose-6-phosphate transaminase (isomerizing) [Anaplasmataceae bacterium AB001_6]
MCGLLAVVSKFAVDISQIFNALQNLEYRGYDSLGMAFILNDKLKIYKSVGTIEDFRKEFADTLSGVKFHSGIAHTRWATHGEVTKQNAHPHYVNGFALVHNGIIENHEEIKAYILSKNPNIIFNSDTDSEVIVQLINLFFLEKNNIVTAMQQAISMMKGNYSFLLLKDTKLGEVYAFCNGNAIVMSKFSDKIVIASDSNTVATFADNYNLEPMQVANVARGDILCIHFDGYSIIRKDKIIKDGYATYQIPSGYYSDDALNHDLFCNVGDVLLKEIYEQPFRISKTFRDSLVDVEKIIGFIENCDHFTIVACGSSYNVALVIREWFAKYTNIMVYAEVSSEVKLRKNYKNRDGIFFFISQSGETADTISAMEHIKGSNNTCIAVVNTVFSSLSLSADYTMHTKAGVERSVAATKTFTSQLALFQLILFSLLDEKDRYIADNQIKFFSDYQYLTDFFNEKIFSLQNTIQDVVSNIENADNILFISRGDGYGIASEAALKVKEIAYIHAEAIPAGELKHGSLALIDEKMQVVALLRSNEYFDKTYSNICEIVSRGGNVIAITDVKGHERLRDIVNDSIIIPTLDEFSAPFAYVAILQLMSYYLAKGRNKNVDRPRNLAKSVTVE